MSSLKGTIQRSGSNTGLTFNLKHCVPMKSFSEPSILVQYCYVFDMMWFSSLYYLMLVYCLDVSPSFQTVRLKFYLLCHVIYCMPLCVVLYFAMLCYSMLCSYILLYFLSYLSCYSGGNGPMKGSFLPMRESH